MKKNFVIPLMAAMCLASCSQDDTLDRTSTQKSSQELKPIAFDTPAVNKATRALINDVKELGSFIVYGYRDASTSIFTTDNGDATSVTVSVDNSTGECSYPENKWQYWIEDTDYRFSAICWGGTPVANRGVVSVDPATGKTSIAGYTTDNESDLLYAFTETTHDECTDDMVPLTFQHQLSKVMFTFKNTSNTDIKISDVQICGVYNTGDAVLAADATTTVHPTWTPDYTSASNVSFDLVADEDGTSTVDENGVLYINAQKSETDPSDGSVTTTPGVGTAAAKLFIPVTLDATHLYKVKFTVKVGSTTENFERVIDAQELVGGYGYNLVALFNYKAIQFKVVEIKSFNEDDYSLETEQAILTKNLEVLQLYKNMMPYNVKSFTFNADHTQVTGVSEVYTSLNYTASTRAVAVSDIQDEFVTYEELENAGLCDPTATATGYNTIEYNGEQYRLPTAAELQMLVPFRSNNWVAQADDKAKYPNWWYFSESDQYESSFPEVPGYEDSDEHDTTGHKSDCNDYHFIPYVLTDYPANSEIRTLSGVAYGIRFKGLKDCAAYRWKAENGNGGNYFSIKIKGLKLDSDYQPTETLDEVADESFWDDCEISFTIPCSGGVTKMSGEMAYRFENENGYLWSASRIDPVNVEKVSNVEQAMLLTVKKNYGTAIEWQPVTYRFPVRLVKVTD